MKRLNKFNISEKYLCSVIVNRIGNTEEIFLNAAITDKYLKMVRIINFGCGFVVDNLDILKNSNIIKAIQSDPEYIRNFRVYSVPTIKPNLLINELTLIHDIHKPTVESLEAALGITLQ